jgi:Predicted periplasmic solute-binding protein
VLKDRRFLSGLGAGIIAGALLLQLMTIGQQTAELPDSDQSNEPIYTEQEMQQMVEKAKEDAKAEANAEANATSPDSSQANNEQGTKPEEPAAPITPSKPEDTKEAVQPEPPTVPDAGAAKANAEQSAEVKQVVIRIEPGTNLTSTAKLLADNGIISSQSKFISTMKSGKKLVRAGYFAFKGEPTLDEVVKTLTGQPLTANEANRIKSNF